MKKNIKLIRKLKPKCKLDCFNCLYFSDNERMIEEGDTFRPVCSLPE